MQPIRSRHVVVPAGQWLSPDFLLSCLDRAEAIVPLALPQPVEDDQDEEEGRPLH